jgi:hypothetical protein
VLQQFTQQKESRRTEEKSVKKSKDTVSASGNKRGVTGTQQSTWTPENTALSSYSLDYHTFWTVSAVSTHAAPPNTASLIKTFHTKYTAFSRTHQLACDSLLNALLGQH